MANENDGVTNFLLSREEVLAVDRFRKSKDTNVLTIMFTDIKGFTEMTEERGEAFSRDIRKKHDEIMKNAIEGDAGAGAGMIVKHIGDSVMAVFTEPSKAVDTAIAIQEAINSSGTVQVRIGLDMGQVTMENEVSPDIFGRHVNRASRVEGLADGGQIYMTFPVFDSAKGFLAGKTDRKIDWASHGKYLLKGIHDPVEIFEVTSGGRAVRRPKSGVRKREISYFWLSVIALIFILSAALYILKPSLTSVTFVGVTGDNVFLDFRTKLLLDGGLNDRMRKSLTPIAPGKHRIWFDRSYCVRYYSDEFTVSMGQNNIEPKVEYYSLPGLESSVFLQKDATSEIKSSDVKFFNYALFDENNIKSDNALTVEVELRGSPAAGNKIRFEYKMKFVLNGTQLAPFEKYEAVDATAENKVIADEYVYKDTRYAMKVKFRTCASQANIDMQSYYNGYF